MVPIIHKHTAVLEKKYKGKALPKRNDIQKLLKSAQNRDTDRDMFECSDSSEDEILRSGRLPQTETKPGNPAKKTLEQHGIVFPEKKETCSSTLSSTSLYRCAPSNKQEEEEQLKMVLNQSILECHDENTAHMQKRRFNISLTQHIPSTQHIPRYLCMHNLSVHILHLHLKKINN